MRVLKLIQITAVVALIISVMALGVEIFINDAENITAMQFWGVTSIICLNVNAFAAIYRLWETGGSRNRATAVFLLILITAFWTAKAVRII